MQLQRLSGQGKKASHEQKNFKTGGNSDRTSPATTETRGANPARAGETLRATADLHPHRPAGPSASSTGHDANVPDREADELSRRGHAGIHVHATDIYRTTTRTDSHGGLVLSAAVFHSAEAVVLSALAPDDATATRDPAHVAVSLRASATAVAAPPRTSSSGSLDARTTVAPPPTDAVWDVSDHRVSNVAVSNTGTVSEGAVFKGAYLSDG